MSRFALPIPAAIHTLIATKTIPQLSNAERLEVTEHLFKRASFSERIAVAEVAYLNRKHPQARDLFLASTMPLAHRRSAQIAYRLFVLPTQWQFECMYNGAFMALLRVFAHPRKLEATPDSFRRYLFNNLSWGAYQGYFGRQENWRIRAVKDVSQVSTQTLRNSHSIEQEIITRDLLEKITQYPLLNRALSKTLECIRELGPDGALSVHHSTKGGNPANWKENQQSKPMLDMKAIAKLRGVTARAISNQLYAARHVLRIIFNGDGRLFQTH
jgi:hypothetical protein